MQIHILVTHRDGWDKILARLRAGEMPPQTVAPPTDEQLSAFITIVERELDRLDQTAGPIRAASRAPSESDRIRQYRARSARCRFSRRRRFLPTTRIWLRQHRRRLRVADADAGGTGSPGRAEAIEAGASRSQPTLIMIDTLKKVRAPKRNGQSDYDADYDIRVNLTGHRGLEDPPVTLLISVDGTPVKTVSVPVQISAVNKQGGGTQRGVQNARVFLTAREHVLRAEFVDDDGLKTIPAKSRSDANLNIFPESIEVSGPFPPAQPHRVEKKALICDPSSGAACVNRILASLAHRAYRRPVTASEVAQLTGIFNRARASAYTPAQSLQFAIAAMLVSPQFLFRIERDPPAGAVGRISDLELASRLSYFLWSSMPDDELLRLAQANRLHLPAVLTSRSRG